MEIILLTFGFFIAVIFAMSIGFIVNLAAPFLLAIFIERKSQAMIKLLA